MVRMLIVIMMMLTLTCRWEDRALADEGQARIDQALDAWRKRQSEWKTARYVLEGKSFVPRHSRSHPDIPNLFPAEDYRYTQQIELGLDFQNQRSLRRSVRQIFNLSTDRFEPELLIDLFDGQEYQQFVPRAENSVLNPHLPEFSTELTFMGKQRTAAFFRAEEIPLLLHHGFVPVDIVEPDLVARPFDSRRYRLVPDSQVDEKSVFVVRVEHDGQRRFSDFHVDADRDFCIIREVRYARGKAYWSVDIALAKTGKGWLPKSWRTKSVDLNGTLDGIEEFQIASMFFDQELSVDLFRQQPAPGMIVRDLRNETRYIADVSGKPGDSVEQVVEQRGHFAAVVRVGVVLVAVAGLVLVECLRLRRKRIAR